jgi:hypothetical protein
MGFRRPQGCLRQQFSDNVTMHVSQAKIAASKPVGQFFVIEAEQMQDCRVQIMHMNRFILDAPADLVGCSNRLPTFHTTASHPEAERIWMMIAAGDFRESLSVFAEWGAAKFATPDD